MVEMIYTDQSVNLLKLSVIADALDTSQFNILCEDSLELGWATLRLAIIGASHFWEVTDSSGNSFSEVLACCDVQADRFLWSSRVEELGTPYKNHINTFEYSCTIQVIGWEQAEEKLAGLHLKLGSDNASLCAMEYIFPSTETNKQNPLTAVCAKISDNNLLIDTAHSYPNENSVVFTRSSVAKIAVC